MSEMSNNQTCVDSIKSYVDIILNHLGMFFFSQDDLKHSKRQGGTIEENVPLKKQESESIKKNNKREESNNGDEERLLNASELIEIATSGLQKNDKKQQRNGESTTIQSNRPGTAVFIASSSPTLAVQKNILSSSTMNKNMYELEKENILLLRRKEESKLISHLKVFGLLQDAIAYETSIVPPKNIEW